ncbi:hypothetical protein M0R45_035649 [Rubus argutus]|uniref:Reverse transcriptase RNase H-like domain-containing protein n=1 Tax=Rubus argutus TaxID=59490 RepID=A0AAW1VTT1_RUBAR
MSYVSRLLQGAEARSPEAERLCLALVYTAQKLRHYFLAHKLHLMVKIDLVRYLLTKPVLSGRLARWLLQLSEFDITCITPRAIKGQALIDMLALFPEGDTVPTLSKEVLGELPEESTLVIQEDLWTLHFDGSSTTTGGGAGIVLTSPTGESTALSFKLNFPCTNNMAEYEGLIIGLSTAQEMGVKNIKLQKAVLELLNKSSWSILQASPTDMLTPLATLGSKLSFTDEEPNISVVRRDEPATKTLPTIKQSEKGDWRRLVNDELAKGDIKTSNEYTLLFGELYKRLPGGILSRCIRESEAQKRLQEMHELTCGLDQVVSLYRHLQRKGYYWPEMKKQSAQLQAMCLYCSKELSTEEACTLTISEDWRDLYLAFLIEGTLPANTKDAYRLRNAAKKYFVDGESLYRKGYNGEPLTCLGPAESQQVLQEVHAGECGEHQGKRKLHRPLLNMGYYWPTM